ncbi:MAG TPA: RNA polymerase sigma factor [Gemmatimonadales bacterium]|nr:RNA polymerase sigma factor [Gemmatimonadales bacterium]
MSALASRTDAELVAESLRGSQDAFAILVRRHQNALYRYGVAFGIDGDTALDLLQDTFVKAHDRLAQCRDAERFRPWLFRIYRNALLDWQRDIRRGEVSGTDVPEPADPADFGEQLALREAIGSALAALPAILREAFLLRHQLGHSYEEIADVSGVTVSAAKMRVMRAREILRDALAPDYAM